MNQRRHVWQRMSGAARRLFFRYFAADSKDQLWGWMVAREKKAEADKPPMIVVVMPPAKARAVEKVGKN